MTIKRERYGIMRISDGAILCDVVSQDCAKYGVTSQLSFFYGSTLMFIQPKDITNEPLYTRPKAETALKTLKNKYIVKPNSNHGRLNVDEKDIKVIKINEEFEVI